MQRNQEQLNANGENWTVVIPYFNEEDYLSETLESLRIQELAGFRLILVDNGSKDRSSEIAAAFARDNPDMVVDLLTESEPGQAAALKCGIARASSTFTAICDADTIYPPHYLATADRLLRRRSDAAAALAFGAPSEKGIAHWWPRIKGMAVASVLAKQCHAGGYAHCFRTSALKATGGYDRALWPFCLKDHELMHRVSKRGRLQYAFDFWCLASERRDDRSNVRWTLYERLVYHATPFSRKDWFFYEFLKPRFEARGLSELKLRARDWEA